MRPPVLFLSLVGDHQKAAHQGLRRTPIGEPGTMFW